MESFSRLLNQYIQRLGISDAELARAVGVSRQTIFRWKEGQTGQPRHREDVLAIARKLRLTPQEQDNLLLSAGFRPETIDPDSIETDQNPNGTDTPSPAVANSKITKSPVRWSGVIIASISVLSLILIAVWWLNQQPISQQTEANTTIADVSVENLTAPSATNNKDTLILVTHLANYAGNQVGYNVAGRVAEAIQKEVDHSQLSNIGIVVWPEEVDSRQKALVAGQTVSATLIIYGEYDVGRVIVRFLHPANQNIFANAAVQQYVSNVQELSTIINTDLPQQVRSLALLALGQIFIGQGNIEAASPLLEQASETLKVDTQTDPKTLAVINFYLGVTRQQSNPPDLNGAIEAYTQAIEIWPQMISSRLNRVAAYQLRNQPEDLNLALADANVVVEALPDWGLAYNNRASIRIGLGGDENFKLALEDLDKAATLDPSRPEIYFNRGYLYLKQGHTMAKASPELEHALTLRPEYGNALNMLCWGFALEQQAQKALPYCQQAVEIEPDNLLFRDSRGLAYAIEGNYPAAIADFQAYVNGLEQNKPFAAWQDEMLQRQEWVELLAEGKTPFTPELLTTLKKNFEQQ